MKKISLSILVILSLHFCVHGQVCTGSLGDPTVVIDFGTKANPLPPLTQKNTSFKPATSGCPNPGEYGFRGLLFSCFDNSWLTTVADHTQNDLDGFYMLINATNHQGIFYSQEVDGLCPNTTYEMSVWIVNLLKKGQCGGRGIKPNVTLQVETLAGAVLGTYTTGDIPELESLIWKQYAVTFRTGSNADPVVLKVINAGPEIGDCGNVLGIDDIAFRPCGPTVSAYIQQNGKDTINVCDDENASFSLIGSYSSGYNNPLPQWQQSEDYGHNWQDMPGQQSTNLFIPPKKPGIYYYRLGVSESANQGIVSCRIYSLPIMIFVNSKPFVQLTNYVYGCYGDEVVIFAAGGSSYDWHGPNGFHSTLQSAVIDSVNFNDEGTYSVKITTFEGCSDTGSLDLVVYPAAHATIGGDLSICEGDSARLEAGGGIKYDWYPDNVLEKDSIPNPWATPEDTTKFMVAVFNSYGCSDTAYQTVNVWKKPTANAGPDKRTRVGLPVTLEGTAGGTDVKYFWSPSSFVDDIYTLRPIVNAPQSAYYTFNVESQKGCGIAQDQVFIKVYDKILIPNAFSPNGDGINDKWVIDPLDLFDDADLQVYNRYGQLVFRNIGVIKPWDGTRNGTPVPVGTYYYILDLKIPNEKPMTGHVTILR